VLTHLSDGWDTKTEENGDESEQQDTRSLTDKMWWRFMGTVATHLANGQIISLADLLRQVQAPQELDMRSCIDVLHAARAVQHDEVKALEFAGMHLCRLIAKYSAEYADPEQLLLMAEESVKKLRGNLLCCATNCWESNVVVRCGMPLANHRKYHRSHIPCTTKHRQLGDVDLVEYLQQFFEAERLQNWAGEALASEESLNQIEQIHNNLREDALQYLRLESHGRTEARQLYHYLGAEPSKTFFAFFPPSALCIICLRSLKTVYQSSDVWMDCLLTLGSTGSHVFICKDCMSTEANDLCAERKCAVCHSRPSTVVSQPCHHAVFCKPCFDAEMATSVVSGSCEARTIERCPTCQQHVAFFDDHSQGNYQLADLFSYMPY